MGVAETQGVAWREEHAVMTEALRDVCLARPDATQWGIAFEYELPLEGGRRPDVVVLAGGSVVVLEFKSTVFPEVAQIDQTEAYARDLADYHDGTHGRPVHPILVLPNSRNFSVSQDGFVATDRAGLAHYLVDAATEGSIGLDAWLQAPYAPLPTLVAAARRIFEHEPLPHVKTAISAGIPEALELLGEVVRDAADRGRRMMAFVTGVPGAGKTLVGLRFVYERSDTDGRATFLSGNGPLVRVLQDALRSRVFVRDLHAFINTYALSDKTPLEHVLVFDEAQRAWDQGFMTYQRRIDKSEPDLLVEVGEKIPEWAALVGLVGEGQEIHSGEEGGMPQWATAAASGQETWHVHCAPRLAEWFEGLPLSSHPELDLTVSLRSRRAKDLHEWVRLLLEGSLSLAARLAVRVHSERFPLYLTRNLADAREYAWDRYRGEGEDKRFGLVASSHAHKFLRSVGFDVSFLATRKMKVEKWFNAPPEDELSCCAMTQPATEFQCQGLELDLPVVVWGTDLLWTGKEWQGRAIKRKYALEDPEQILKNVYRVLMTRGRDGLVVFIPPDIALDATEHALLAAGVKPLPERLAQVVG